MTAKLQSGPGLGAFGLVVPYEMAFAASRDIFSGVENPTVRDCEYTSFKEFVLTCLPQGFVYVGEELPRSGQPRFVLAEDSTYEVILDRNSLALIVAVQEGAPVLSKDNLWSIAERIFARVEERVKLPITSSWRPGNTPIFRQGVPATNTEPEEQGLRRAKGTKFVFVLDSYLYAVARTGATVDDVYSDGRTWNAILFDGEEVYAHILRLAAEEGVAETALGLTLDEMAILDTSDAFIVMEDGMGFVETRFFEEENEAWEFYEEILKVNGVDPNSYWEPAVGVEDLDPDSLDEDGELLARVTGIEEGRGRRIREEEEDEEWSDTEWAAATAFTRES